MNRLLPLIPCACTLLITGPASVAADPVALYTEDTLPPNLRLLPGITRITGALSPAGDKDVLAGGAGVPGTLIGRATYQHQTGNVITGTPENAHLTGIIAEGVVLPPSFLPIGDSASLTSPFYIQNGNNAIQAQVSYQGTYQGILMLEVPAGKSNPSYTAEIEYIPRRDAEESGAGNNTLGTSSPRPTVKPAWIERTLHGGDEDWYAFPVPAGRTLTIREQDLTMGFGLLPDVGYEARLVNSAGAVTQFSQVHPAKLSATAGASDTTFYLRLHATNPYAFAYALSYELEDSLEPNDSLGEAAFLGTLNPTTRVDSQPLTVSIGTEDHFYLATSAAGAGDYLIAVLDETPDGAGYFQIASDSPAFSNSGIKPYAFVTLGASSGIHFRVTGGGNYRIVAKPKSAYDTWQHGYGNFGYYRGIETDDDADGLQAGIEWALRLSPVVHDPSPVSAPYFSSGQWRVNLAVPAQGTVAGIHIKESTDLQTWTDVAAARSNTGGALIPPSRSSAVVVTLNRAGEERNFVRFQVDQ